MLLKKSIALMLMLAVSAVVTHAEPRRHDDDDEIAVEEQEVKKPKHHGSKHKKHAKKHQEPDNHLLTKPASEFPPRHQQEGEGLKLKDPKTLPVDYELVSLWKKKRDEKPDCMVPGRQYLRAQYIGNRVWSNYAKVRLGTGFYVIEYQGNEADDYGKDKPLVVNRNDAGWMASGGKEFVFRDLEYGGKAWLRTGQAGGKCAGFNSDNTEVIMWRCNRDGTYPEFFYSEEVQLNEDGQPWFADTFVFFRQGQNVYRPFIQVLNPATNSTKILLDQCDALGLPAKATPKTAAKSADGKAKEEEDQAVLSMEAAKSQVNQGEIVDPLENYNRMLYGAHEIVTVFGKEAQTAEDDDEKKPSRKESGKKKQKKQKKNRRRESDDDDSSDDEQETRKSSSHRKKPRQDDENNDEDDGESSSRRHRKKSQNNDEDDDESNGHRKKSHKKDDDEDYQ